MPHKTYNTPKRKCVVKTRLTEDERRAFEDKCAALSMTQSEYIRQAVFYSRISPKEAIKDDLINANVYLMESDGYLVGTGTIKDNVIKRLFILPQYQHHKFGTELLQCLEDELAVNDIFTAAVDVHEQVRGWYQAMGYAVLSEQIVDINGETLPYYHMEKQVTAMNMDNLNQGLMF